MSVYLLCRRAKIIFSLVVIILTASTAICAPPPDTIFATANLPVTGGGFVVSLFQYLGVSFSLTQTTQITGIGGVLSVVDSGSFAGNLKLFGAIAAINPSTGFPADLPTNFQPIAETVFSPPLNGGSDTDTIVPLSTTLAPGTYALIFGSNRFGATGSGSMQGVNGDIGNPSYFVGAIHNTSGTDQNWENDDPLVHNLRFVILGNVVPEPSSLILLGFGTLTFLAFSKQLARS